MSTLSKDFFITNRQRLIKSINKAGIIIIPGNGLMQRSADTTYPFRQDSNLYYLTGIQEPCATLVIDTIHNEEWVMLPIRSGIHQVFDGATDIAVLSALSGITDIVNETEGWQRLKKTASTPWYTPLKPKSRIQTMYTNPYRAQVIDKARRVLGTPPTDVRPALSALRSIKSTEEISIITKAVDITHASLNSVIKSLNEYSNEQEIEAELTKQFQMRGASGHAYQPIVAGGLASCTLHYVANNAQLVKGDILLFDIGSEFHNYAADISRTIVFGAKPSSRQFDVLTAVTEIQQEIINWLKPGVTWKELAEKADATTANKLVALNLIQKKYQKADIRTYFPHAVSHFLGLDVHDVGDYSQPLAEGMVITVEPGIYSKDESIGVRIEDDVVITSNGAQILGSQATSLL